jgi:hypothetical protein
LIELAASGTRPPFAEGPSHEEELDCIRRALQPVPRGLEMP